MSKFSLLDLKGSSGISALALSILFFGMCALNIGSTREGGNYLWLGVLALSFALAAFIFFQQKMVLQIHKILISYFLFTAFGVMSLAWASSSTHTIAGIRTSLLTFAILIAIVFLTGNNHMQLSVVYQLLSLVGLLFILYMVIQHGVGVLFRIRGGNIANLNSNTIGHSYFLFAIASWATYRCKKGSQASVLYLLLTGVYSVLLLFTASKAWVIGLLLFFLIYFMRRIKNRTLRILFLPIIILAGVLAYVLLIRVPFLYNIVGYRLVELNSLLFGQVQQNTSTWYRLDMMRNAWELFLKKPIFGYGLNNSYVFNTYQWVYDEGTYFHNNYLELMVGVGIIGTVLYYMSYIGTLFAVRKNYDDDPAIEISYIFLITCFATDLTGVSFYYRPQIALIFIIYICVYNKLKERKLQSEVSI